MKGMMYLDGKCFLLDSVNLSMVLYWQFKIRHILLVKLVMVNFFVVFTICSSVVDPFHATGLSILPENRKPGVLLCFQWVKKEASDVKWVKVESNVCSLNHLSVGSATNGQRFPHTRTCTCLHTCTHVYTHTQHMHITCTYFIVCSPPRLGVVGISDLGGEVKIF